MSIRLEMLEAAARGARALGKAQAVEAFVLAHQCEDGGFRGRGQQSDLYYTVFALQTLQALGRPIPPDATEYILRQSATGNLQSLDLVHTCCLVGCWACYGIDALQDAAIQVLREQVLSFRSGDSGFAIHAGKPSGSAYGCFLALSALLDLREPAVAPGGDLAAGLAKCVTALQRDDGGFANEPALPISMTPATAASLIVLAQTVDFSAGEGGAVAAAARQRIVAASKWLHARQRHQEEYGFAAVEGVRSDLLSTATALHALSGAARVLGDRNGILERIRRIDVREYVLHMGEPGDGFRASADDTVCDCEYTFYGLLALGHLAD
jgi:hypothetical protein